MQLKIDHEGFNMQIKSWKELGKEVGLTDKNHVHWQTIKTAIEEFNYHNVRNYIPLQRMIAHKAEQA